MALRRGLVSVLALCVALVTLSGCSQLKQLSPLPDEQRYHFINEVRGDLDYASSGDVVTKRYDYGDGVFSPSFFFAEIEGVSTFDELTERLKSLDNAECSTFAVIQTACSVGQVDVTINHDDENDTSVVLKITDIHSGRTAK